MSHDKTFLTGFFKIIFLESFLNLKKYCSKPLISKVTGKKTIFQARHMNRLNMAIFTLLQI